MSKGIFIQWKFLKKCIIFQLKMCVPQQKKKKKKSVKKTLIGAFHSFIGAAWSNISHKYQVGGWIGCEPQGIDH